MRQFTATLLMLVLLTQIAPAISAKPKGDWNAVRALDKHSIAVKTKSGETHYGLLQVVDETGILVEIAGKDDFTGQQIAFQRDEVEKVWRAKLRFGEKNIAKGAWIGAGAGLGAAFLTAWALSKRNDADACVGCGLFPLYGAGIGGLIGAFWKKKHKKQELIYSV